MNGYEQFIALTLASTLAIFLILGIVLMVIGIKIANRIKHIAEKAESVVDKAEDVAEMFQKASGKYFLVKFLNNLKTVVNKRGK